MGVNILAHGLISILFVSLFISLPLEASVFSFVTNLFSSGQANAEDALPNSQNMALLQASISPDLGATTTKNDISIMSGTSLSPESQGPFSDGKDHSTETDQISLYVVRKGDTLPAIAKMFGVTTNTISWSNDLKRNSVTVGQTLVILPISGVQHVVKSGDTLKSITSKYKGDLNEILQYNNLSLNSRLAIGDTVFIPDGEVTTIISGTKSSSRNSSGSIISSKSSYPVYDGYYIRPIVGGIKTQGIHGHNGVDLASTEGSKIMASAEGDVIISKNSGWNGGYGDYVVIKHNNGTQTLYGHLSDTAVSVGDHVEQGQTIGYMGHTGQVVGHPGTHLHFEIRGARNPF